MRRVRILAIIALALALTIPTFFVTGLVANSHASPVPGHLSPNRHAVVFFPSRPEWARLTRTHKPSAMFPAPAAVQGSGDLTYGGGPVQHNPKSYL
ncbi:MAG TPA: hypothetical protein VKT52_05590, partial [Ktedonobacterales bacterium]|nr:hypothetical protein [Ktedonobacterales bacterium]